MLYHCIHIQTDFTEEWQKDVFEQQLFDLGADTGLEQAQAGHTDYYIQSELWTANREQIEALCHSTESVTFLGAEQCPDENWNATWEAEHPIQELPLGIRIVPHCAFGAGYHETTSMMIDALLATDLTNKRVLDHGTGTGVLAIFAKHLGVANVIAVDIDEKSVVNAQENAALNDEEIDVRLGSTPPTGPYDLILANIHRNVLLANMPAYAANLAPNGELWLSGFYEKDCPTLIAEGEKAGLHLRNTYSKGDWRMLIFAA